MRIFLTGATGFIGSKIVPELLQAGHQVLGMTRSDEGAKALTAAGAHVHRGELGDLDSLRRGAAQADAVIIPPSTTTSPTSSPIARRTAERSRRWGRPWPVPIVRC